MDKLILEDCAIDSDQMTLNVAGNTIEFQIILGEDTFDAPWVNLDGTEVQRLYDYLGEWLATRQTQNTGLGDK